MIRAQIPLEELTEKAFDALLVGTPGKPGLALQLGFRAYHTLRSKGSSPGFPDWTLARDRVIFIESKTEKGQLTDRQRLWLGGLVKAGAEVYVARPRYLEELAWVLAKRYRPRAGENPHGDALLEELEGVLALDAQPAMSEEEGA